MCRLPIATDEMVRHRRMSEPVVLAETCITAGRVLKAASLLCYAIALPAVDVLESARSAPRRWVLWSSSCARPCDGLVCAAAACGAPLARHSTAGVLWAQSGDTQV